MIDTLSAAPVSSEGDVISRLMKAYIHVILGHKYIYGQNNMIPPVADKYQDLITTDKQAEIPKQASEIHQTHETASRLVHVRSPPTSASSLCRTLALPCRPYHFRIFPIDALPEV